MIAGYLKNSVYIEFIKFFRIKNFFIVFLSLAICACVILIDFHLKIHEKFARYAAQYASFKQYAVFVTYYLKNLSPKLGTISYLVSAIFALLIWEIEYKVLPVQVFFRPLRNACLLVLAKFCVVTCMSLVWLTAIGLVYGWLINREFPADYPMQESYRLMFQFGAKQLYYSSIITLLFFSILSLFRTNIMTGLLIIAAFYFSGSWLAVYPLGRLLQADLNLIQVSNLSLTTDLALAGLFFFITVYKVRTS
ncbi:hypothetical protein [Rhodoflexus sp.]